MSGLRPTPTIFVLLALAAQGCGPPAGEESNVSGTVVVAGELARRGLVTFHPAEGGAPATGRVHDDGSYSLRIGQGNPDDVDDSRIPAGEYLVTVVVNGPPVENPEPGAPPFAGPRLMASRYGSKETTDLKFNVQAGKNVFNLDLDPAEPATEADAQSSDAPENAPEDIREGDAASEGDTVDAEPAPESDEGTDE